MIPETRRLLALLAGDGRKEQERERLVRLMQLLAGLPPPPDPGHHFEGYEEKLRRFVEAAAGDDGELLEERFLELYALLHMHEAPYTRGERAVVDESGGYWSHAGGLSPILKAGPWLGPRSVSADYGAGNGLQGLLMQLLDPHAKTLQIEISAEAVEIGKCLQRWLGLPRGRVEWVVDDVRNVSPREVDFVYLYRPLHPAGPGDRFYRWFASELAASRREQVIFSVADCLQSYLGPGFRVFYTDGHLTCFEGPRRGELSRDPGSDG
jgi:hypothetical protein